VLFGSLYDTDHLSKAVDECLGKANARAKLSDLDIGLIVPAVDWVKGRTQVFISAFLGKAHASNVTLRDVCLATAAAPTYFKPHDVDGLPMLDGGLAANNPDVLAIMEMARRWPDRLARTEVLSIGTAGADAVRTAAKANKSGLKWAPSVANFIITVQESTAAAQAQRLLGNRYLRVNHVPSRSHPAFENLDVATEDTRTALLDAGAATAKTAYANHRDFIDRMLSDTRHRK
jgi:uncharacterized protein